MVGSLREALQDLERLNRFVWDEVIAVCSEESLRKTVSQRSLSSLALRQASAASMAADVAASLAAEAANPEPQRQPGNRASPAVGTGGHEQPQLGGHAKEQCGIAPNGLGTAQVNVAGEGGPAAGMCDGRAGVSQQAAPGSLHAAAKTPEVGKQDVGRAASHAQTGVSGQKAGSRGEWCLELGAWCCGRPHRHRAAGTTTGKASDESAQDSVRMPRPPTGPPTAVWSPLSSLSSLQRARPVLAAGC